jgi:hypothetical protein
MAGVIRTPEEFAVLGGQMQGGDVDRLAGLFGPLGTVIRGRVSPAGLSLTIFVGLSVAIGCRFSWGRLVGSVVQRGGARSPRGSAAPRPVAFRER